MKQPPFKVRCIKRFNVITEAFKNLPEPQIGDVDTATEIREYNGISYYTLERFGPNDGFACRCFATLPDTTEEVAIEQESEALIYQR